MALRWRNMLRPSSSAWHVSSRHTSSFVFGLTNEEIKAPYLAPGTANYRSLTPLSFFKHAVKSYPDKICYVHGDNSKSWGQVGSRVYALVRNLCGDMFGLKPHDVVSVLAPNSPAIFELHFAVPLINAILHCINTRLDAQTVSSQIKHSGSKVIFVDAEFAELANEAISRLSQHDLRPRIVLIYDNLYKLDVAVSSPVKDNDYDSLTEITSDSDASLHKFEIEQLDELDPIALNYTSGTTGDPKGVLLSHRGAYLNSLGVILDYGMQRHIQKLWIVPLFHCNGWCFAWAMAALAGTSYFCRTIRADIIFDIIERYKASFMAGAPVTMLTMLAYEKRSKVLHDMKFVVAGAPPPPPVITRFANELGIHVQTAYGLTEVYGPISGHSADHELWDAFKLDDDARLGRSTHLLGSVVLEDMVVMDPKTMMTVPADGQTRGEVMLRGNVVMKGYYRNPKATEAAFKGGYFHTGDIAVSHPNGRIELKDRSKDIIISGGENIASIEVENVLLSHPSLLEAAVVAMPHERWGEVPCAFVSLRADVEGNQHNKAVSEEDILAWARTKLPGFMTPKKVVFGHLPKTSTGKVQKHILRDLAKTYVESQI